MGANDEADIAAARGVRRAARLLEAYSGASADIAQDNGAVDRTVHTVMGLATVMNDDDPQSAAYTILGLVSLASRLLTDLADATGQSTLMVLLDVVDPELVDVLGSAAD